MSSTSGRFFAAASSALRSLAARAGTRGSGHVELLRAMRCNSVTELDVTNNRAELRRGPRRHRPGPGDNRCMPAPAHRTLTIATRESRLALWQAEHVRDLLVARLGIEVKLLGMTTRGDQILDRTLSKVGGKGLFVKELETALEERRADLAVHSLKDVPMDLPDGFALAAVLEREDPRDALGLAALRARWPSCRRARASAPRACAACRAAGGAAPRPAHRAAARQPRHAPAQARRRPLRRDRAGRRRPDAPGPGRAHPRALRRGADAARRRPGRARHRGARRRRRTARGARRR